MISCLMPTYNRAPDGLQLLGQAVQSFLDQSWPADERELLIGNDTPGQRLTCDAPGVRIINYDHRLPSLGAKIQDLAERARGQFLCRWDDDDVSLPWRLSTSMLHLGEQLEWRPRNYWWFRKGRPDQVTEVSRPGNTHVMAIWRLAVLDVIGGYPLTSGNEDQEFNLALAREGISRDLGGQLDLTADRIFYVYRWGVSPRHLSGGGGTQDQLQAQWRKIGQLPISQGDFEIQPNRWQLPGKWVRQAE